MAGAMKKAGFTVPSFKPEGGERTYRINTSYRTPLFFVARPALAVAGFLALIPTYCLAFEARRSDQWSCMKTTHDGNSGLTHEKSEAIKAHTKKRFWKVSVTNP